MCSAVVLGRVATAPLKLWFVFPPVFWNWAGRWFSAQWPAGRSQWSSSEVAYWPGVDTEPWKGHTQNKILSRYNEKMSGLTRVKMFAQKYPQQLDITKPSTHNTDYCRQFNWSGCVLAYHAKGPGFDPRQQVIFKKKLLVLNSKLLLNTNLYFCLILMNKVCTFCRNKIVRF
jgi:hypothetical protein